MLNTNNNKLKKSQVPLSLICIGLGGVFLFQYLTFIPEYSHAVTASNLPTLDDISTMQEMTPDICYNTDPGATKQLEDTRLNDDGKTRTYWVTKLPDGNCWMTQNLDYDDPGGNRVTDTSGSNGGPGSGKWPNNNTVRQYWDPGEKVVSGSTLANATTSTDKHLLVGNYYSWLSAVAGGDGTGNGDGSGTDGSICPAGWQLPTSNNTNNGSFAYLQSQGGISSSNGSILNDTPYFFQYSGAVGNGNLDAGSYGLYWSSTSSGSDYAYSLNFLSTSVNPSHDGFRYLGRSIRCLTIAQKTTLDDLNVSVTVKPVLTLEIKNKDVVIDPELNRINTGEFTAIVSSSTAYTLSLSSDVPALTNNTSTSDTTIPSISNTPTSTISQIEPGTNMWGIRTCNKTSSTVIDDNEGVANEDCPTNPLTYADSKQATNPYLGISPTLTEFAQSSLGVYAEPTLFQVGIGIAPNLPAGTYQTNVTVTASQK